MLAKLAIFGAPLTAAGVKPSPCRRFLRARGCWDLHLGIPPVLGFGWTQTSVDECKASSCSLMSCATPAAREPKMDKRGTVTAALHLSFHAHRPRPSFCLTSH
ncbi:hypothetical protein BD626DRAFT_220978 [Schizophyllum amplum]|uniref:Uncharacterized protein n=1 Tax=Schizophyllum amplum TaxID=97359 RepID=A0A550CLG7_9AGAR|nr:hypothetical protein BD626DRAFT_220978 [Auriculariopsis ampla]